MRSLALLTDLYELTMAYAYWKQNMAEDEAVFHLFFRRQPFQGGYAVCAGLELVIDYIKNTHFDTSDLDYLATLQGADKRPLFEEAFLTYLAEMRFSCDIDAVVEGDLVFPYEPLIRVRGPILQAQLLESVLLNLTNFSTLIATKAARVCQAAQGDQVLEFGLRRAQGIDGAITATRASYIGGCHATSHVLGGKLFGIPVAGTHAHSWVMAFDTELASFEAYAKAMPNNCVFLVDTYDSLEGVRRAITVAQYLKKRDRPFLGIRLDSGDLAYLSKESRKMLDKAGFSDAKIFASNELEETLIADLKAQGAPIAVWGVGTHLVTGHPQPALDGVYKLSAIRKQGETQWKDRLKLSERMTKVSNPGILQVRRYFQSSGKCMADMIYDVRIDLAGETRMTDPFDATHTLHFETNTPYRDLLVPIFRKGECIYTSPPLSEMREQTQTQLATLDPTIKRFANPHVYPVGLESSLYQTKISLVESIRQCMPSSS